MKNVMQQEEKVDRHILELKDALTGRLSSTMKGVEFTEWIRWFLLDTMTDVIFSEPSGFLKEGRDVDHMIEGLRDMSLFALLLGTFPWLVNPIIDRPFFRKWLLPHIGDRKGAGIMMSVRRILISQTNTKLMTRSITRNFSSRAFKVPKKMTCSKCKCSSVLNLT